MKITAALLINAFLVIGIMANPANSSFTDRDKKEGPVIYEFQTSGVGPNFQALRDWLYGGTSPHAFKTGEPLKYLDRNIPTKSGFADGTDTAPDLGFPDGTDTTPDLGFPDGNDTSKIGRQGILAFKYFATPKICHLAEV